MANPTLNHVLDQSAVDALLNGMAGAKPAGGGGRILRSDTAPEVAAYDFRNPAYLAEPELRRLKVLHDDVGRYFSARLSLYLRMEFNAKLAKLETLSYGKFTDALGTPTHLTLFKAEPLSGVGILEISPRLALAIADRLLGGRGHVANADRHLTEIEAALMEDVLEMVLEEWCAQWKPEQELRHTVLGHEQSGRFLHSSNRDAVMLVATLECSFGDCTEPLQIAIPHLTIDPILRRMQSKRQREAVVAPTSQRPEWHAAYDGISIPLRAEWTAFEATVRELAALSVGDVIQLDPSLVERTQILINGVPKFMAVAGREGDRVAVQLTRKLSKEESDHGKFDGRKSA